MTKILLMGNPNVGKSALFSRLTGVQAIVSNYPGTTISYTQGYMKLGEEKAEVIDAPGTYTLEPTSEAEEIARKLLDSGDIVINVVNAINLERNLYLTLQLLERGKPVVVALNLWDDTKHRGVDIDLDKLRELLGVLVIPTVAITGQGIKELVEHIPQAISPPHPPATRDERWAAIGQIIEQVQQIRHRHHTWRERLEDASVSPVSGGFIAVAILAAAFFVVRFIGEGLINYVLDPLFNTLWAPVILKLSQLMGNAGFLHDMVVGKITGGEVNFLESFGLLTSGLYVPLGVVLPYIVAFYLVLGILEDTGYLPRLAVLMDTVMHRLGLRASDTGHPHPGEQKGALYRRHPDIHRRALRRPAGDDFRSGRSAGPGVCGHCLRHTFYRLDYPRGYPQPHGKGLQPRAAHRDTPLPPPPLADGAAEAVVQNLRLPGRGHPHNPGGYPGSQCPLYTWGLRCHRQLHRAGGHRPAGTAQGSSHGAGHRLFT
jgi:small GTP-binding protein